MVGEDKFLDDNPPPVTPTQQSPHTLSTIKLPILKKGNGPVQVSTDTNGQIKVLPPKTAEEILARERERKARTTLLMAIPEDHLAKFHKITDAKEMIARKGHDRFQSLLSSTVIHGEGYPLKMTIRISRSFNCFWSQWLDFPKIDEVLQGRKERLQFDAKEPVGFDKTKVECFNCHNTGHFTRECRSKGNQESRRRDARNIGYKAKDSGRRPRKQEEPKDLVTLDGEGVDWTGHVEDEQENLALIAYSHSGSDTEVTSCSEMWESYAKLKKLYDTQGEQLGDASKMSTRDKYGLGYRNQIHEGVLSYEKEVLESVFDSRSSDVEDSPVYDRFSKVEGMHAVPPPMTGNYMPPKFDFGINESNFTYVNTARQNPSSQAAETSTARKVNTARPIREVHSFNQDIDFLTASHIHYALTENPTIYASFIKQFWTTATANTTVNGEVELTASIDGQAKTITEASLRRHLKLEGTNGNEGIRVLALESIKYAQAAKISALKSRIKKLEKKYKPSISHYRAWLKSMNRLSMKKKFGKKESVSKQGRKKPKPESTLDDSIIFDDQDADHGIEYMETKEAVDEGRKSGETEEVKLTDDIEVVEDKGGGDKRGNAKELVSTARPEVSTTRPNIDAARQEDSDVEP
ncbi:ribonuclease H-like domain-containing protein [Tanacetum coccineum]